LSDSGIYDNSWTERESRRAGPSAAREAINLRSTAGCRYFEAEAQLALAGALLLTEDVVPRAEIDSALERAEQLALSIDARSLSPRILEMRGRLARELS